MRRAALALSLAASTAGAVQAADLSATLLAKGTDIGQRSAPANPGGVFDIGSRSAEAAALLEGQAGRVRWRVRGEAFGADGRAWPDTTRLRVQELSWNRPLNETWSVSAGKQVRSWDQGLTFTPLGFFRTNPSLRDPTDSEGRVEGLPMLAATYLGEVWTVEAAASAALSEDPLRRLNGDQVAVRVARQVTPAASLALVARQRRGAGPGAGFSLSTGGETFEAHADVFYGPAPARYDRPALYSRPARLLVPGPAVLDEDPGYSLRSVAGLTWTPRERVVIQSEWVHKGDGLSSGRWNAYQDQVRVHRAALDGATYGVALANLGQDLSLLGGAGSRRDYLALNLTLGEQRSGLAFYTFCGLADGGCVLTVGKSWRLARQAGLNAGLTYLTGPRDSEFRQSPVRTVFSVTATKRIG